MPLPSGTRLGPYQIDHPLGAGGMGEVYKASDTRLDRTVAIKVLSANIVADPQSRERFEREARTISRLNHPHICTLFDIGSHDGIEFLVMEFLEGETLHDRLMGGSLPIDQVLRYAIEIAAALDQAHRQRIVHRDLKPANVMLTKTGAKLLDFGVAKWRAPQQVGMGPTGAQGLAETQSLTAEGTILGTLQYMAPEQLEGKEADARADLFAFGAVVYEMATGRKAFSGGSRASLIAAVLTADPAPMALKPVTPPGLERIVKKCLVKDPDMRWQTARDLLDELRWMVEEGARIGTAHTRPSGMALGRRARLWLAAVGTVVVIAALATVGVVIFRRTPPDNSTAYRFAVSPPEGAAFSQSPASFAVSPDGRLLAFTASSRQGNLALWIQPLDSLAARMLPGTESGAGQPFWSADSRSLAFVGVDSAQKDVLKKIDVAGGPPQPLIESMGNQSGTWNRDGVILLKPTAQSGIHQISAWGGPAIPVTTLDQSRGEISHNWPQFLPDGRQFLYLARSSQPEHDSVLYVASLDGGRPVRLFSSDSHGAYAAPGYLIYIRDNTLFAQPFDAGSLRVTGEPVPIAEQVERNPGPGSRRGAFSVSQTGVPVLAYRPIGETQLVWFDRGGRRLERIGPTGHYSNPALSPDERQVAVARLDPQKGTSDIWLIDLARGPASPFTSDPAPDDMPLWSHDGKRIAFKSLRAPSDPTVGAWGFYEKAVTGAGPEETLLTGLAPLSTLLAWSPDGKTLVYGNRPERTLPGSDLWRLPLSGDRKPVPFLRTQFWELQGNLSPDGRWIAYVSDESGRNEVYVRAFPSGEGKVQISVNGGGEPAWRSDGKELFYLAPDRNLMAVAVKTGSTVELGPAERLFPTAMSNLAVTGRNQYVADADGQRFLINEPAGGPSPSSITVVVNWTAGLRK